MIKDIHCEIGCSTGSSGDPGGELPQDWIILNPSGSIAVRTTKPAPRPLSLKDKTVVLRWNLKHNGNYYLDRIAELLQDKVPGVKIIKLYEIDKSTNIVSGSHKESTRVAQRIAEMKADLVIGAQAD